MGGQCDYPQLTPEETALEKLNNSFTAPLSKEGSEDLNPAFRPHLPLRERLGSCTGEAFLPARYPNGSGEAGFHRSTHSYFSIKQGKHNTQSKHPSTFRKKRVGLRNFLQQQRNLALTSGDPGVQWPLAHLGAGGIFSRKTVYLRDGEKGERGRRGAPCLHLATGRRWRDLPRPTYPGHGRKLARVGGSALSGPGRSDTVWQVGAGVQAANRSCSTLWGGGFSWRPP